jgi:pSer/pThr/pTyr-binding forkhead associated (FHA) protein
MYRRGDVIKPPTNPPGTMLSEFDGWKLVSGTVLKNGKICDGNVEYKAVFRDSRTETASGFLVRMKTKEVIPILKELLLGSSPRTGGYAISSAKEICAEHAKIVGRGFQYFLLNLSNTSATLVNKTRIAGGEEVRVYHNDTITLGEEDFRLITNDKIQRPQKVTEKNTPYLLLIDSGLKIGIDHTPFELGRSYQGVWTSLKVGRQHVTIFTKGEEYFIADYPPYSKNGTFVNGELLKGSAEHLLHPGDQIRIADVSCKFLLE